MSAACVMWSKIEPIPLPQPDGEPKQYSDKIRTLVEEISSLTLSETAQLSELLKVRTNTVLGLGWLGSLRVKRGRLRHCGGLLCNSPNPQSQQHRTVRCSTIYDFLCLFRITDHIEHIWSPSRDASITTVSSSVSTGEGGLWVKVLANEHPKYGGATSASTALSLGSLWH